MLRNLTATADQPNVTNVELPLLAFKDFPTAVQANRWTRIAWALVFSSAVSGGGQPYYTVRFHQGADITGPIVGNPHIFTWPANMGTTTPVGVLCRGEMGLQQLAPGTRLTMSLQTSTNQLIFTIGVGSWVSVTDMGAVAAAADEE